MLNYKLPDPVASYVGMTEKGRVDFSVLRLKDLYATAWNSKDAKAFLIEGRETYDIYGSRPKQDELDSKSANYCIIAQHKSISSGRTIVEVTFDRKVPGFGNPLGVAEPEIYHCNSGMQKGKTIDLLLHERFKAPSIEDSWRKILSSSRLCAIRPRFADSGVTTGSLNNSHTPTCFALIQLQFLIDYPDEPFEVVTSIIRPELEDKGLYVQREGFRFRPYFMPAYQFLDLDKGVIELDRSIYAHSFPTYWYKISDVMEQIDYLVRTGDVSQDVVDYHFNDQNIDSRLTLGKAVEHFFAEQGMARRKLDLALEPVPQLKITPVQMWYQSMLQMLDVVGVDFSTRHRKVLTKLQLK